MPTILQGLGFWRPSALSPFKIQKSMWCAGGDPVLHRLYKLYKPAYNGSSDTTHGKLCARVPAGFPGALLHPSFGARSPWRKRSESDFTSGAASRRPCLQSTIVGSLLWAPHGCCRVWDLNSRLSCCRPLWNRGMVGITMSTFSGSSSCRTGSLLEC